MLGEEPGGVPASPDPQFAPGLGEVRIEGRELQIEMRGRELGLPVLAKHAQTVSLAAGQALQS